MKLADAEKFPHNSHWTIYDGTGRVYRARRDRTTGRWWANQSNAKLTEDMRLVFGRTLREVREKIAKTA